MGRTGAETGLNPAPLSQHTILSCQHCGGGDTGSGPFVFGFFNQTWSTDRFSPIGSVCVCVCVCA